MPDSSVWGHDTSCSSSVFVSHQELHREEDFECFTYLLENDFQKNDHSNPGRV